MFLLPLLLPARLPALLAVSFYTSLGTIQCTLRTREAPKTVQNFVDLALGKKPWRATEEGAKVRRPLYNGTIFHRVIPEFMIQGGDPLGNGMGGPGYDFPDENLESSIFDGPGKLAMANRGPDTNGSQFFITEVALPHLNGTSQIFGDCQNGEVVQRIARVERVMDRPVVPVVLERVVITGR